MIIQHKACKREKWRRISRISSLSLPGGGKFVTTFPFLRKMSQSGPGVGRVDLEGKSVWLESPRYSLLLSRAGGLPSSSL